MKFIFHFSFFMGIFIYSAFCQENLADKRLEAMNKYFPEAMPLAQRSMGLGTIACYVEEKNLGKLQKNHLRFFCQPWGIIESAIDINLGTGSFTIYPGTHDTFTPKSGLLSPGNLSLLKNKLNAEDFRNMRPENKAFGMDGYTYFVEAYINGSYIWKDRWGPEKPQDTPLIDLADFVKNNCK